MVYAKQQVAMTLILILSIEKSVPYIKLLTSADIYIRYTGPLLLAFINICHIFSYKFEKAS